MSEAREVRKAFRVVGAWTVTFLALGAVTGSSAWESSAGECLSFVARTPPSSFRLRCLGEGSSGVEELMGEAVVGTLPTISALIHPRINRQYVRWL